MTKIMKEHQHTLELSKVKGGSDEGTVAQLVVTNAVNGKPHSFHVRLENTQVIDINSSDVFHNNPSEVKCFYDGYIEESLESAIEQTKLYEIVTLSDKAIQTIEESYATGNGFSFIFGPSQMADGYFSLHHFIVNEELADLMIEVGNANLTIDDIVDFGKLVEADTETYKGEISYFYPFFEEVVEKAQQNKPFSEEESKYVNIAMNYLNFSDEDN